MILPMPLEVKERYLEIREASSDAVIAVVEILSPTNKRQGEGRRIYEAKRQTVLGNGSHLVEIDLLRAHEPIGCIPLLSSCSLLPAGCGTKCSEGSQSSRKIGILSLRQAAPTLRYRYVALPEPLTRTE